MYLHLYARVRKVNGEGHRRSELDPPFTNDIITHYVKGLLRTVSIYFFNVLITDLHNNVERDFPSIRQLDWCAFLDLYAQKVTRYTSAKLLPHKYGIRNAFVLFLNTTLS